MPHGPWTALLIGAHWPDSSTLETLATAARNRHAIGMAFDSYAESLRSTSQTVLGVQEGTTAQDARDTFAAGEAQARTVAEKNLTRKAALERAHAMATEFRAQLSEIAERGTGGIQAILDSKQHRHDQVARIAHLVAQAQTEANIRAAACSQEMLGSIQSVLDHSRGGHSAREFAAAQGVDLHRPYSATHSAAVRREVEAVLSPTRPGADVRASPAAGTFVRAQPVSAAAGSAVMHQALRQPAVTRHPNRPTVIAAAGTVTSPAATSPAAEPAVIADQRLRGLLEAVARQEPRLRWMIGHHDDGSIVLATDLAGGWIPPHVDIPAGVGLPAPGARRDTLLGPATRRLTYQPGQYLPPNVPDVAMSPDARHTVPVCNLGAELTQAAGRAGLQGKDASTVAHAVLDSYPTAVDPTQVADWQLLAGLAAFTKGDLALANYHFSWFQVSR